MFGQDIPDPIDLKHSTWNINPYTNGCWSFFNTGMNRNFLIDLDKANGTEGFWVVGEAYPDDDSGGCVHGAYRHAIQMAPKIAKRCQVE